MGDKSFGMGGVQKKKKERRSRFRRNERMLVGASRKGDIKYEKQEGCFQKTDGVQRRTSRKSILEEGNAGRNRIR